MTVEPTPISGEPLRVDPCKVVRTEAVPQNDVDAGDQSFVYVGSMRNPVQVTGSPLEVARRILKLRRAP